MPEIGAYSDLCHPDVRPVTRGLNTTCQWGERTPENPWGRKHAMNSTAPETTLILGLASAACVGVGSRKIVGPVL
jgi:hypothetical protein